MKPIPHQPANPRTVMGLFHQKPISRFHIFQLCTGRRSIRDICKILNLAPSTVHHHIMILQFWCFVKLTENTKYDKTKKAEDEYNHSQVNFPAPKSKKPKTKKKRIQIP